MSYLELVKAVKRNDLKTRFDVVSYCMGYFGEISRATYNMIRKLYTDGYVTE